MSAPQQHGGGDVEAVCPRCAWSECACRLPGGEHCNVRGCQTKRYQRYKMCKKHLNRWRKHRDVNYQPPTPEERAPERFWQLVRVAGPDECWIFEGTIHPTGYGDFQVVRKHWRAHRFAWVDQIGLIPDGLTLDHLCNVRACVNPAHLEPVTNAENLKRMHRRRSRGAA